MKVTPASRKWVGVLARTGYATKGVLDMLVGGLAVAAALDQGGNLGGASHAERTLSEQPFGQLVLAILAIGLFALCVFRLALAFFDLEPSGSRSTLGKIAHRVFSLIGAAVAGALGVLAAQLAWGERPSSDGGREWLSWALSWHPVGPILVVVAALGVSAFAFVELKKAWTTDFCRKLHLGELSPSGQRFAIAVGRAGLAAHGLVLGIVGFGLARAAWKSSPRQPCDIGSALREVAASNDGQVLLVLVAAGLFAYGMYGLVQARYREIAGQRA